MDADPLAQVLGRWADGLAPAARDQLSTFDLRALYDHLARRAPGQDALTAFDRWHRALGPATQAALSQYDRRALADLLRTADSSVSPTAEGPATSPTPERCGHCGGTALVRTGSCLTCQDCGTTTGCG